MNFESNTAAPLSDGAAANDTASLCLANAAPMVTASYYCGGATAMEVRT